ncbi:MAG: hypothetical protein V3R16_01250 [Nitrospirales bacterium]
MDPRRYQVTFSGMTADGHDPESVQKKFRALFKLDAQRVAELFSGNPVVIKKGLTREAADQYFARLERIGAISAIEPMEEAQPVSAPDAQGEQNDKGEFACPKCGFQQPPVEECARCGIIIRKFKKDQRKKPRAEEHPVQATAEKKHTALPMPQQVMDSFRYPLTCSGMILIITGSLFFLFLNVMMFLPFIGIMVVIFAFGYLTAFMFKIINDTAEGGENPPDWPGCSDFWIDIVKPFVHTLSCSVMSFIPLLALLYLRAIDHVDVPLILFLAAVAWGLLYSPMALLAIALFKTVDALNPVFIVRSIFKVGPRYLGISALLILIWGLSALVGKLSGNIAYVGFLLSGFVGMYFTMVSTRMIGLMYYTNTMTLNWFGEADAPLDPPRLLHRTQEPT